MVAANVAYGATALEAEGENVREDVSQIISNISPIDTPCLSNFGKTTATADLHEWLIDDLATAVANNAHVDGDDFGTSVVGDFTEAPQRIGNYLQISKKQVIITRRAEKMSKHGRKSEMAYQIAKKLKEIKRDMESSINEDQVAVVEAGATPARSAGIPQWLTTNDNFGATGASGALSNGTYGVPTTARTQGTLRALSEASMLLPVIRDAYIQGGDPNMIVLAPAIKQRFSTYMFGTTARIATPYQDHGADKKSGVTAIGAVDVYVSDFGVLDIVPNRFMNTRHVFILDSSLWEVAYLDGVMVEKISKIGDSERRHIIADWGLVSRNEAGSGMVTDVQDAAMVA